MVVMAVSGFLRSCETTARTFPRAAIACSSWTLALPRPDIDIEMANTGAPERKAGWFRSLAIRRTNAEERERGAAEVE
jgi:hypothetical protein